MNIAVKFLEALKRVVAGRTALILDEPFFGQLALKLVLVEDLSCKTAWTDGVSLGYNPAFITKLTFKELVGLVVHEVLHCAYGHPWREGGREHKRWNKACDLAINSVLRSAGFQLPARALFPEQFNLPEGKSAEWYYDRIPEEQGKGKQQPQGGKPNQSKQGDGAGQGQGNEPGDADAGAGEDEGDPLGEVRRAPAQAPDGGTAPTEEDWQQAVQAAAVMAEGMGKLPGNMKRFAEKLGKSRIDWVSHTKKFAQEVAASDYSWRRPNARYVGQGLYMPKLYNTRVGIIAIGVDTSGSIDQVLLNQFGGVMQDVIDEVKPRQVVVLYSDAKVHRVDVFEAGEPLVLRPEGGGGTDFRPVFSEIEKLDEAPACVIYLTDLAGTFPQTDPGIPTLWVTARDEATQPPFGEVLCAA